MHYLTAAFKVLAYTRPTLTITVISYFSNKGNDITFEYLLASPMENATWKSFYNF